MFVDLQESVTYFIVCVESLLQHQIKSGEYWYMSTVITKGKEGRKREGKKERRERGKEKRWRERREEYAQTICSISTSQCLPARIDRFELS